MLPAMKKIVASLLLFCCLIPPGMLAQNKIKQYEYWLDNNLATKQTVSVTPTACLTLDAVPIAGLSPGIHVLNLRFLDSNDRYSAVVTQRVEAFSATPRINSCEYWFDESYAGKTVVSLTPSAIIHLTTMDLAPLSNGFHRFNIRFSDAAANWSVVQTSRIYKSAGNSVLVNLPKVYRYWIDDNVAGAVTKTITNPAAQTFLNESIDLTSLPKGNNHILHLQMQDALGLWSSVQSMRLFNTGGGGPSVNQIWGYRFWVDNDFASNVYVPFSTEFNALDVLNLSAYTGNDRRLNLQFKDAQGLWSSVLTDTLNVVYSGLNELSDGGFRISPNPNDGAFTVYSSKTLDNVVLSILNSLGETVYREEADQFDTKSIRLQNAGPGIYFLRMTDKKTGKLLISRKIIVT